MDLPSITAAPWAVTLQGRRFRVSPVTVAGIAELLADAERALPPDESREGKPPLFSAAATHDHFYGAGKPLLVFLALHRHHPELTYEDAHDIALAMDVVEDAALVAAFFRRRPRLTVSEARGVDLADTEWGPVFAFAQSKGLTYEDIGRMTLDQIDNLCTESGLNEDPGNLSRGDVQRMWEAAMAGGASDASEPAPATHPDAAPMTPEIEAGIRELEAARAAQAEGPPEEMTT